MKQTLALVLALFFLSGCTSKPDEKALATTIEASMRSQMPLMIVGNMLGGTLVSLEEIEIEEVRRETWKPNPLGSMFGMKEYDYWKVTARVKGTAQVGATPPFTGGRRGFHRRHIWGVVENEDGSLSVKTNDFFAEPEPEQPANPGWWDIGSEAPARPAEPQSAAKGTPPQLTVMTRDGVELQIPDFTQGMAWERSDSGTERVYSLVAPPSNERDPPFALTYITNAGVTIGLFRTPLGTTRAAAESALRQYFPVDDQTMCRLKVFVYVANKVDSPYRGHSDLGLSFCPGATPL